MENYRLVKEYNRAGFSKIRFILMHLGVNCPRRIKKWNDPIPLAPRTRNWRLRVLRLLVSSSDSESACGDSVSPAREHNRQLCHWQRSPPADNAGQFLPLVIGTHHPCREDTNDRVQYYVRMASIKGPVTTTIAPG